MDWDDMALWHHEARSIDQETWGLVRAWGLLRGGV